jgi:hypothetical protein
MTQGDERMNTSTTATSSPATAASSDLTPDRDQIAQRAYYLYLDRGRADGSALDDWLRAEKEIRQPDKTRAVS